MKKFLMHLGLALMIITLSLCCVDSAEAAKTKKNSYYTVKGQTVTVKVTKNKDISKALDEALKYARDNATAKKKITVKVPKGTYKLNSAVHIYSNTTLDVTKVTLKDGSSKSHTMLMTGTNGKYKSYKNYNNSKAIKGYNGFKNITIKGGTWVSKSSNTSTIIRLFHGKNITMDGVTVKGGGCAHQVEVAAINGFKVKNCTFKDFGKAGAKEKQEALQLDIPCSTKVFREVYMDGTVMKNVEITGCTFSNVPRGVGSHTLLNGAYNENIKINNNTFTNVKEEAIVALNYKGCEIKDNKIENCGAGILVQFYKATPESIFTTTFDGKKAYTGEIQHDADTIISGNTITTKYYKECDEVQGIKVYGLKQTTSTKGGDGKKIPKKNYYISNVTIENNTITTAGNGIHVMDARNITIQNNTITQKGASSKNDKGDFGIWAEKNIKSTTITNNTIKNMKSDGIFVQESAEITTLSNNMISGCKQSGINFYMKSSIKNPITENTIKNCKSGGIMISTECDIAGIVNNKISLKEGDSFINVYKESNVDTISKNTLENNSTDVINYGMKITNTAVIGDISENILSSSTNGVIVDTGILLDSSSKVTTAITKNQIGKIKTNAIKVVASAEAAEISYNKFTAGQGVETAATAILVDNKANGGNIQYNEIDKVSGIAIKVSRSGITGNITNNKIVSSDGKTVATQALLVDGSSKVNGSINNNEIANTSDTAVKISNSSTVSGSISNNIIKDVKGHGILIYSKSKVGKDISGNTISNVQKGIFVNASCTVTGKIKGNTITSASDVDIKVDSTSKTGGIE